MVGEYDIVETGAVACSINCGESFNAAASGSENAQVAALDTRLQRNQGNTVEGLLEGGRQNNGEVRSHNSILGMRG